MRLCWQSVLQVVFLGGLFLFLPITIAADLRVPVSGGLAPAIWLCKVLVVSAGLPFFVIATMTPTLQRWFSLGGHPASHDPYFLYAVSNAGSLLGLLTYPWIVEPSLTLSPQSRVWATGTAVLAVLVLACAAVIWRRGNGNRQAPPTERSDNRSLILANAGWPAEVNRLCLSAREVAQWIVLAFIPSSWLLGVTAYISTDLAAVPLLWTVPLGIYLLTCILAFAPSSERWFRPAAAFLPLVVAPLVMVLSAGFAHLFWIPLHLLAFFVGALVCHGQLAAARPESGHATAFYLAIALGGVLGGIFNALLAPVVFDRLIEYPLVVVLACLVAPCGFKPIEARRPSERLSDLVLPVIVAGLTAILVTNPDTVLESVPGMLGVVMACGLGVYACVTGLRRPSRFALTAARVLLASGLAQDPGGRASAADMACRIQYDLDMTEEEKQAGKQPSIWAVLARREADLGKLAVDPRWQSPRHRPGTRPWTDGFSDLASYLVLGVRRFPAAAAAPRGGQDSSSLILRTRSVVLSPSRRGQIATLPP